MIRRQTLDFRLQTSDDQKGDRGGERACGAIGVGIGNGAVAEAGEGWVTRFPVGGGSLRGALFIWRGRLPLFADEVRLMIRLQTSDIQTTRKVTEGGREI